MGFQAGPSSIRLGLPKAKFQSQKGHVLKQTVSPRFTIRDVATHSRGTSNGSNDLPVGRRGLSVPPSAHVTRGHDKDSSGQGQGHVDHLPEPHKHHLPNDDGHVQERPSVVATSSHSVSQPKHGIAARVETTKASSFGSRREDLKQKGFNDGAIDLIQNNIKSIKTYKALWKKFCDYCVGQKTDPFTCPIPVVSNYLHFLFQKGLKYRSVCTHASTISKYHHLVSDRPVGVHPYITEVLKGIFLKNPPIPKYQSTWNVDVLLEHLASQHPPECLSLRDLTTKTLSLVKLSTNARTSSLLLISSDSVKFDKNEIVFKLKWIIKTIT